MYDKLSSEKKTRKCSCRSTRVRRLAAPSHETPLWETLVT